MSDLAAPDRIRGRADIERHDGERVSAIGRYEAVPRPIKGGVDAAAERDHAVVILDDETRVYLEPIDDPRSVRSRDEIERLDGQVALVIGRVHRYMPGKGETLVAPCLADLEAVEPARPEPDDAANADADSGYQIGGREGEARGA